MSIWIERRIINGELRKLIPTLSGIVLDIGCGPTPYKGLCIGSGIRRYIAFDWPSSPHGMKMNVAGDMIRLPFRDGTIDSILCTQVLEHCRQPSEALVEASRVLRNGGRLLMTLPFLSYGHELPWDYYRYTHEGVRYLLEKAGFEIKCIKKIGGPCVILAVLISRIICICLEYLGDIVIAALRKMFKRERNTVIVSIAAIQAYSKFFFASCIQLPVYGFNVLVQRVSSDFRDKMILRKVFPLLDKLNREMTAGYVVMAEKSIGDATGLEKNEKGE